MEIERIERLKAQALGMNKTFTNLGEAFNAFCEIVKDLVVELNKIQDEQDDQATLKMEQNERNP